MMLGPCYRKAIFDQHRHQFCIILRPCQVHRGIYKGTSELAFLSDLQMWWSQTAGVTSRAATSPTSAHIAQSWYPNTFQRDKHSLQHNHCCMSLAQTGLGRFCHRQIHKYCTPLCLHMKELSKRNKSLKLRCKRLKHLPTVF